MNGFVDNSTLFVLLDEEDVPCKFAEVDRIIELSDVGCDARSPRGSLQDIAESEKLHRYGTIDGRTEKGREGPNNEASSSVTRANSTLREVVEDSFASVFCQGSRKLRDRAVGQNETLIKSSPSSVTITKLCRGSDAPSSTKRSVGKEASATTNNANRGNSYGTKTIVAKLREDRDRKSVKCDRTGVTKIPLIVGLGGRSTGISVIDSRCKGPPKTSYTSSSHYTTAEKVEKLDDRQIGKVKLNRVSRATEEMKKRQGVKENAMTYDRSQSSSFKGEGKRWNFSVSSKPVYSKSNSVPRQRVPTAYPKSKPIERDCSSRQSRIVKREESIISSERKSEKRCPTSRTCQPGESITTIGTNISTAARNPRETPWSKRDPENCTIPYPPLPEAIEVARTERVSSTLSKLTEKKRTLEEKGLESEEYDETTIPVRSQSTTVKTYSSIASRRDPVLYEETDARRVDVPERSCTLNSRESTSKARPADFLRGATESRMDEMARATRQELKRDFVERRFRDYECESRNTSREIVDIGIAVIERIAKDRHDSLRARYPRSGATAPSGTF